MKKLTALTLSLLLLISLCACGSSAKSAAYEQTADMAYDAAAPMAAQEAGGFSAGQSNTSETRSEDGGEIPEADPQKIIYSSDATLETTDFEGACAAAVKLVEQYGGWIESSSISGANYYSKSRGGNYNRSAGYQFRVPSEKFSVLMNELSSLGNVPYSHTYTENVTAQYYDLDARLNAYKTQESRLLEMMEKAETVSDIVTIEDRLTELRYQIESIQSSLNNWDRQVSYSLVCLNVEEVQEYTPEAKESYGQKLWRSLTGGLKDAAEFLKDLLVFLVGALPMLILLAVVVFAAVRIIRAVRRSRKAKKEKKLTSPAEDEKKQ